MNAFEVMFRVGYWDNFAAAKKGLYTGRPPDSPPHVRSSEIS